MLFHAIFIFMNLSYLHWNISITVNASASVRKAAFGSDFMSSTASSMVRICKCSIYFDDIFCFCSHFVNTILNRIIVSQHAAVVYLVFRGPDLGRLELFQEESVAGPNVHTVTQHNTGQNEYRDTTSDLEEISL